jgi:hypothetical protein
MIRYFVAIFLFCLIPAALGQDITNHSVPVGGGPGVVGWKSIGPCAAGELLGWASALVDPSCVPLSSLIAPGGVSGDIQTNNGLGAFGAIHPGAGISTALTVNIGSTGAPVLFNGAGGTPSSLVLTSATGLPCSTGIASIVAAVCTWMLAPSSANLYAAMTTKAGTGGSLMFNTAPTATTSFHLSNVLINDGVQLTDGTTTGVLYISTGGAYSVGTTSNHVLDFYTNNILQIRVGTNGHVQMPNVSTSAVTQNGYACFGASGDIVNSSGTCLSSSERYKDVSGDYTEGCRLVSKIKAKRFRYKKTERKDLQGELVGLMAEDMEALDPRFVSHNDDGSPQGIRYDFLTAALLNCIAELVAR